MEGVWKPGESGNPRGRRKGSLNVATRLRKLIDVEKIITALQTAAEAGDVQAARTLLERALPATRATYPLVQIPAATVATTRTERAQAIVAAATRGEVAPDIAASLVAALAQVAHVAELDELERRIAALERGAHEDDEAH